jgi:hypothetical protein
MDSQFIQPPAEPRSQFIQGVLVGYRHLCEPVSSVSVITKISLRPMKFSRRPVPVRT